MTQTLETCVESHEHDVFDHAYIPKRLIDVRPHIPQLTLREDHESSPCVSTPKYTALSYCWGSGKGGATTTLATLSDRRVGIAETELPLVVRDAIQVTRALGIPFLWVDALCILQDDPSDWERQCTEMHNIYGSAHVTICAANSRAWDEGFLRQTGRAIRVPFRSRQAPDIKGSFLVQYKSVVNSFSTLELPFLHYDTHYGLSRWSHRGWVFQEQLLSTRRLIFGARDLYFLCSRSHQRRGQNTIPYLYDQHIGKSEIDEGPLAIYKSWIGVIAGYSNYKTDSFTNSNDVLPAISGLAQILHGRLKDGYYAGHWGRDLYRSLLWIQFDEHTHSETFVSSSSSREAHEDLIIASWSALNKGYTLGPFDGLYGEENEWYDCRSEIHLLHAKAMVAGLNPFVALTECSLCLQGYTLDLNHQEVEVLGPFFEQWWRGFFVLVAHGRRFGSMNFDCRSVVHNDGWKCFSQGDFRHFKLLLLKWCDYFVPEVSPTVSESGSMSSSEHFRGKEVCSSQTGSSRREQDGIECSEEVMSDGEPKGHEGFDSPADIGWQTERSGEEASTASHGSSGEIQSQQSSMRGSLGGRLRQTGGIVRKGFGLIVRPTGKDGEFYRVGVFSPIIPRPREPGEAQSPLGDLGGDIRELQSLAQVETVVLV